MASRHIREERSEDNKIYTLANTAPYIHPLSSNDELYTPYISYLDSVESGKSYYYRVFGVDCFGELSPAAEGLRCGSINTSPPAAPEEVSAGFINDREVQIHWNAKDTLGLKGFILYKSFHPEKDFLPLYFPVNQSRYPVLTSIPQK